MFRVGDVLRVEVEEYKILEIGKTIFGTPFYKYRIIKSPTANRINSENTGSQSWFHDKAKLINGFRWRKW